MAPIIRELSKSMINKIAAGEVVERPANVVKELVENSIDAGATRVEIEVEKGGIESIKIIDDGCGISPDQLVLALSPHSTSKLSEPDDLFRIHTLGFRGEALASIAEISHLTLVSRSAESREGAEIRSDGGARSEILPRGRAVGTTIEVRDIFFNVPARRKFLKSPQTEFGHVQEAVVRMALPNPNIAFVLKHNGRLIYDLPANEGVKDRIRRIFKEDVASRLIHVEMTYKEVHVEGYVGSPDLSRSTTALQYLFLNKRYIRDHALQHAVTEAYRGLQLVQRYPVTFLNVTVPVTFVDFNVHPTKMEARFVDAQGIYAGLLSAIRTKFLSSDLLSRPNARELTAAAERSEGPAAANPPAANAQAAPETPKPAPQPQTAPERELRFVPDVDPSDPKSALDDAALANSRKSLSSLFGRPTSGKGRARDEKPEPTGLEEALEDQARLDVEAADDALAEAAEIDARRAAERSKKLPLKTPVAPVGTGNNPFSGVSEFRKFPPLGGREPSPAPEPAKPSAPPAVKEPPAAPKAPALLDLVAANNAEALLPNKPLAEQVARTSKGKPVVQMCSRYLVMEAPDGIAIVDQHALHERILYERFKLALESGSLDVQRLLVPEVVDLSPVEAPVVAENKELFLKLGVAVEEFGGSSVVVNSYPAILRDLPPAEIFMAILGAIRERKGKVDRADLLDFTLKQTACKAAIKAGDALRPESVVELVARAEEEVYAHHCPHGRPSTLVFTCQEIDKLFKRT